jgi:hypothetical protein
MSFWGQPQTPWLRFAESWVSAKQNYAFCFFFWKKKNTARGFVYARPKVY